MAEKAAGGDDGVVYLGRSSFKMKVGVGMTSPEEMAEAARMAATFPLISPAVYLPTRPAVRVVDSGFRDNYGVELAADWIFQNREWLKANLPWEWGVGLPPKPRWS